MERNPVVEKLILDEMLGHQTRIEEKIDSLTTTLMSHIGRQDAREESQTKILRDIQIDLYGNGKPGMKLDVDRMKRIFSRLQWTVTAIVAPLLIYAGYVLIQRWLK
jgi:hypothetical protein